MRADLNYEVENYAQALADADTAMRLAPDDPRGLEIRVRALRALGRNEEALAALTTLLATSHAEYYRTLPQSAAELMVATGRNDQAIILLEHYLHDDRPSWQDGWLLLASAYDATGDAAGAARARRNASTVAANEVRGMHRQARISHWRGWDDVASGLLEQVVTREPDNAAARAELEELRRSAPANGTSGG